MSWFLPTPKLYPGERLLWRKPASLALRTAVGGALHITTERIIFIPNRLNWGELRATHEWATREVATITVTDRDYTPYTGGMRKRMCIGLKAEEPLMFVVKRLDDMIAEVRDVLAQVQ